MPPAGASGSGMGARSPDVGRGRGGGWLRSWPSRQPATRASRAGTWPLVKVVRPVGRSTLTRGQNPAPLACGSTADGMATGSRVLSRANLDCQDHLDTKPAASNSACSA